MVIQTHERVTVLWLRDRTSDGMKCEKARNIKEKRHTENFNTVLKLHVEHHSSQRDNKNKFLKMIESRKYLYF